MDFRINGFDQLMADIGRLSNGQMEEAVRKGVRSMAATCAAQAKLLAPTDSSELRNSIHFTAEQDGTGATGIVYTNSDHAAYVEFGTGPVGAASGGDGSDVQVQYNLGPWLIKRGNFKKGVVVQSYEDYWVYKGSDGRFHATRGMKPRPFMYPAAQASKKLAMKRMTQAFRKFISKQNQGEGGE